MTVDIAAQVRALCQAILLGGALGVVYDLMRLVRRRVRLGWLSGTLDFLFWVLATAALFLFSHGAWNGRVRLYGAVFCLIGGAVYFWGLSPQVLAVAGALADLLLRIFGILTLPLRLLGRVFRRFEKIAKNIFSFLRKWYMINSKPKV